MKTQTEETYTDQVIALAQYLSVEPNEINEGSYSLEYGDEEYKVLTDDEADTEWDAELDNYLDECVYPELPPLLVQYFDDEKWKQDARYDGRGHSLSSYDGQENVERVEGTDYYIYRIN